MKSDKWGARHDYEQEQADEAMREAHENWECRADCPYCEASNKVELDQLKAMRFAFDRIFGAK